MDSTTMEKEVSGRPSLAFSVFFEFLNVTTILLAMFQKVPQILNLIRQQTSKGISLSGLLLGLTSYSITMSYNYVNRYSIMVYMEYPILAIQDILTVFLVLKYSDRLSVYGIAAFGAYFAVMAGFATGVLPSMILTMLIPFTTPVSASSKIMHLMEILRSKDSEAVSLITWTLSAYTNFARIFTIYMDSADIFLLSNFIVSTALSTSILFAAWWYKKPKRD